MRRFFLTLLFLPVLACSQTYQLGRTGPGIDSLLTQLATNPLVIQGLTVVDSTSTSSQSIFVVKPNLGTDYTAGISFGKGGGTTTGHLYYRNSIPPYVRLSASSARMQLDAKYWSIDTTGRAILVGANIDTAYMYVATVGTILKADSVATRTFTLTGVGSDGYLRMGTSGGFDFAGGESRIVKTIIPHQLQLQGNFEINDTTRTGVNLLDMYAYQTEVGKGVTSTLGTGVNNFLQQGYFRSTNPYAYLWTLDRFAIYSSNFNVDTLGVVKTDSAYLRALKVTGNGEFAKVTADTLRANKKVDILSNLSLGESSILFHAGSSYLDGVFGTFRKRTWPNSIFELLNIGPISIGGSNFFLDTTGKVTTYNSLETAGMGIVPVLGVDHVDSLGMSLLDTEIPGGDLGLKASGLYRVSAYLGCIDATGSSSTVRLVLYWTQSKSGAKVSDSTATLTLSSVTAHTEKTFLMYHEGAGSVVPTYSVVYAAGGGSGKYKYYISAERIN